VPSSSLSLSLSPPPPPNTHTPPSPSISLPPNPKQYVVVIPPKKYTDISFAKYDMADASHRRKLWFGRIEIFFGREGTSSPWLKLNVHFGRPQPRTITVQQPRANKELAQKAAYQKRAQRKPYTQSDDGRTAVRIVLASGDSGNDTFL
jgi:hypothetical protein